MGERNLTTKSWSLPPAQVCCAGPHQCPHAKQGPAYLPDTQFLKGCQSLLGLLCIERKRLEFLLMLDSLGQQGNFQEPIKPYGRVAGGSYSSVDVRFLS